MKIENSIIQFEAADAALLNAEIQAAVISYNGEASVEIALSGVVNSFIDLAKSVKIARELDVVKTALLEADAAERADAQTKIDEAKIILGVQFNPKEEKLTFAAIAVK